MDDRANPYAPPRTRTEDPPSSVTAPPRPAAVKIAVGLIITLMVFGLVRTYLRPTATLLALPSWMLAPVLLLSAAIRAWIAYKIYDGRNWARVLIIVQTAATATAWMVPALRVQMGVLTADRIVLIAVAAFLLVAASIALLLPSSNRWFRGMKEARRG